MLNQSFVGSLHHSEPHHRLVWNEADQISDHSESVFPMDWGWDITGLLTTSQIISVGWSEKEVLHFVHWLNIVVKSMLSFGVCMFYGYTPLPNFRIDPHII